jgi:hypothetical protein
MRGDVANEVVGPMIGMSRDDGCGEPGEGGISLLRFPSKGGKRG